MKQLAFATLLFLCFLSTTYSQNKIKKDTLSTAAVTIGLLNGGGSLVGVDFEVKPEGLMGAQIGFGIFGFGAGLNVHTKPTIRSSFFSIQYWHQGFGLQHVQSLVGPGYVYRSKKWFTFQVGLGFPIEFGPQAGEVYGNGQRPKLVLMYAIGGYIPIKPRKRKN